MSPKYRIGSAMLYVAIVGCVVVLLCCPFVRFTWCRSSVLIFWNRSGAGTTIARGSQFPRYGWIEYDSSPLFLHATRRFNFDVCTNAVFVAIAVPPWFVYVCVVSLLVLLSVVLRNTKATHVIASEFCPACRYCLAGGPHARCPECGTPASSTSS